MQALSTIRAAYPEVDDIGEWGPLELELYVDRSMAQKLCPAPLERPFHDTVTSLGLPKVDALNRQLGATQVHVLGCLDAFTIVTPVLPRYPNISKLSVRYRRLPGVMSAHMRELGIGDGMRSVKLTTETHSLRFLFRRAWGDCPAGCIYHRTYEYRYYPSGASVRKLREEGDPMPPTD
jgi:hypothetical protein